MFDVCAVGHVTWDVITVDGEVRKTMPGGAVYYVSLALRRLGRKVAVVTKMASEDAPALLSALRREEIEVSCLLSPATSVFENLYSKESPDLRAQRVSAVAAAFVPSDLREVRARLFHLGPLTNGDMRLDFLRAVSARGEVSLDVQGLVRKVEGDAVRPAGWAEKAEGLACVSVLKADAHEARLLTGESEPARAAQRLADLGPREVIITFGKKGSLIFSEGRLYHIPPVPTRRAVDPTGCGDTYIAAYLHRRMQSDDPGRAGRFAATAATLTLERFGPLQEGEEGVERALGRAG